MPNQWAEEGLPGKGAVEHEEKQVDGETAKTNNMVHGGMVNAPSAEEKESNARLDGIPQESERGHVHKEETDETDDYPSLSLSATATTSTIGPTNRSGEGPSRTKEKGDAPRIRLNRKRFQEKRRRKEFREALDTLLATMSRYDQTFAQETRRRQARMVGRQLNKNPLSEDNPLFNRVEMVTQANFTILNLTETGKELRKTLETMGGKHLLKKLAKKYGSTSNTNVVFHQGVGPLASHEVPPIKPDTSNPIDEGQATGQQQNQFPDQNLDASHLSLLAASEYADRLSSVNAELTSVPNSGLTGIGAAMATPTQLNVGQFDPGNYQQHLQNESIRQHLLAMYHQQMQISAGQQLQLPYVFNLQQILIPNQQHNFAVFPPAPPFSSAMVLPGDEQQYNRFSSDQNQNDLLATRGDRLPTNTQQQQQQQQLLLQQREMTSSALPLGSGRFSQSIPASPLSEGRMSSSSEGAVNPPRSDPAPISLGINIGAVDTNEDQHDQQQENEGQ